jgi:hypothetical protein
MRGWRRKAFSTAVAVISAASIAQLSDAGVAKAAAPALPVSSGTATVVVVPSPFNGSQAFTLNGSIAVGNGIFNGTASGTATGPYVWGPAARNPVPPFTLEGPSLTGTCSGQWLADPTGFRPVTVDPTGLTSFPPPPPVNVVSLSCALQLGLAAPAQTSLTLAVLSQNAPTDSQFSGAFGPGVSSIPTAVPPSRGIADVANVSDPPTVEYHLLGDLSFGGQVFHGDAFGAYDPSVVPPGQPFAVTGASPSGNLTATCDDSRSPLLSCTGQVGTGTVGTATLIVLTPLQSTRFEDGCGHCGSSDSTGVFIGA